MVQQNQDLWVARGCSDRVEQYRTSSVSPLPLCLFCIQRDDRRVRKKGSRLDLSGWGLRSSLLSHVTIGCRNDWLLLHSHTHISLRSVWRHLQRRRKKGSPYSLSLFLRRVSPSKMDVLLCPRQELPLSLSWTWFVSRDQISSSFWEGEQELREDRSGRDADVSWP